MRKKVLSLALILSMLLVGAAVAPMALAAQTVSASTPLTGSSDAKRTNVRLAVDALYSVYVPYGATFSFNDMIGPRTRASGFVAAENGRGAVVQGGGVSQVATTLYLALRGVPGRVQFGPISTYGSRFSDTYVADGDLAVITDDDTGRDLSFTNLADDMTIAMWMDQQCVYCTVALGQSSGSWYTDYTGSGFVDWGSPTAPPTLPPPSSSTRRVAAVSIDCGGEAGVLNNVRLAAECVNDTTLSSGSVFSFNDVVGPRTKAYGYQSGTNGRGARVVGGGVSQVASALWLAVKDLDDIAVVEKSTYGQKYNQSYVSSSADAIVTDYRSGRDFSFRYTGPGSVTLYTWLDGETLRCEVYGDWY